MTDPSPTQERTLAFPTDRASGNDRERWLSSDRIIDRRRRIESMLDCSLSRLRLQRPRHVGGTGAVAWSSVLDFDRPWMAVVSSRIGHRVAVHRQICRQIVLSAHTAKKVGATWIVGHQTAIEPWLRHAADRFQIPLVGWAGPNARGDTTAVDWVICRDDDIPIDINAVVMAIADRVDVVRVRRRGKIAGCLDRRLAWTPGLVRVSVDDIPEKSSAGSDWLARGAVGRYLPPERPARPIIRHEGAVNLSDPEKDEPVAPSPPATAVPLTDSAAGEWLVHCTRGRNGPWPGQALAAYRDDLLLGPPDVASRGPLDALRRIVRTGCLVAGAVASRREHPVVCFSAVPIAELLSRRQYRSHLKRWDYEPFGVAIRREAAERFGCLPAIYGDNQKLCQLDPAEQFRFVAQGDRVDWTREQEWRVAGSLDLTQLRASDVRLFVPNETCIAFLQQENRHGWKIEAVSRPCTGDPTSSAG